MKRGLALGLVGVMLLSTGCSREKALDKDFSQRDMLELTVWETQGNDYVSDSSYEETVVEKWLVDKTKVHVEDMYGNDGGQWDPKLTKLISGDNLPHIIHCGTGQGAAHFNKLDQTESIKHLTPEMLQEYAPEVWKNTPKEWWDKMTINGNILGIPYGKSNDEVTWEGITDEEKQYLYDTTVVPVNDVTYTSNLSLWIRDDILRDFYPDAKSYDELVALLNEKHEPIGDDLLDIPIHSTDEFIDFMYKIKDANITENGTQVYSFGYQGGDCWAALCWLGADMYGYKNHYYTSTWNRTTERMEVPLVHDMIRQAARTQNKMIRDRVIDPESLVHTLALFKEKVLAGRYAIVPLNVAGTPSDINEQLEKDGKTFRYRPFITQVPNQPDYPAFKAASSWRNAICFTKELSDEELYQVLNWINVQYTEEFGKIYNWGPEEAGLYDIDSDGKYKFKDDRYTRTYFDGEKDILDKSELLQSCGYFAVGPYYRQKWEPKFMNRDKDYAYAPTNHSGFKFKSDSVHVKNVVINPTCQVWDPEYAEIPEVVSFWGAREQWESKFKIAFAATSEQMFEQKWDEAVKELNEITDIEKMEEEMTKIAKPLAEQLKEEGKY